MESGGSLAAFSHPLPSVGKGWVFLQIPRGGRAQWLWSPVNLKVGANILFGLDRPPLPFSDLEE